MENYQQNGNAAQKNTLKTLLMTGTFLAAINFSALAQSDEVAQTDEKTDEAAVMQPILVEGASYETEKTGGYSSNLVSVGEKDVLTIREIPQSTHVVTREQMEDRGYTSLGTALSEVPGVKVLASGENRPSPFSRGFEYDQLLFNGLPAPVSSIYGTAPDMAIVDHIEVLRGPQGLYGGSGEPAGTINLRLKQAQKEFGGSAAVSGGSWGTYRADADVTGPLTENGKVRGRLVAGKSHSDGWIRDAEDNVDIAYGTIAADITENTTLTFTLNHMARDFVPHVGVPAMADGTLIEMAVNTRIGADWDYFENSTQDYILELEHKLQNGGHAKFSMRYADRDVEFEHLRSFGAVNASGTFNNVSVFARDFKEESLALDAHVSKPLEIMDMDANIILGADFRDYESELLEGTATVAGTFNVHNWNMSAIPRQSVAMDDRDQVTETTQYGLYTNFRISPVEPWTVIAGSRFSWYETEIFNRRTNAVSNSADIDAEFTPYLGTTYDLNDNLTAYASYTSIFQPSDDTDVNGNGFDPRTGNQYEIGMKASSLSGDLNASVALFRIDDKNRTVRDPNNAGFQVAADKATVEGLEIGFGGRVLNGVDLSGGYTYTISKNHETGNTFSTWTPKHMFKMVTKYDVGTHFNEMEGLSVGGSLEMTSDFYNGTTTRYNAPGYTVVDAFTNYEIVDGLTASFNVDNVFNKKYYERTGFSRFFNFYGKPRTYTFKLKADF